MQAVCTVIHVPEFGRIRRINEYGTGGSIRRVMSIKERPLLDPRGRVCQWVAAVRLRRMVVDQHTFGVLVRVSAETARVENVVFAVMGEAERTFLRRPTAPLPSLCGHGEFNHHPAGLWISGQMERITHGGKTNGLRLALRQTGVVLAAGVEHVVLPVIRLVDHRVDGPTALPVR